MNKIRNTILLIEDDPTIIKGLESAFSFHGFNLITAMNGDQGLTLYKKERIDLVIIDVMLPDIDGFDLCKRIREENKFIPIIFLTAKSQESDKLLGFELGADDYVTKPFSAKELIARVNVHLKKTKIADLENKTGGEIIIGKATVNFDNFTISKDNQVFTLTPKEHKILKLLHNNIDLVVTRDQIMDMVWGDDYYPNIKTIDNFIRKLRLKIEEDPKKPQYLINIFGTGFKLIGNK
jgi:DNA-binding response OmpR family regulator